MENIVAPSSKLERRHIHGIEFDTSSTAVNQVELLAARVKVEVDNEKFLLA